MSQSVMYIVGAGGHAISVAGTALALGYKIAGAVTSIDDFRTDFEVSISDLRSVNVPLFHGDVAFQREQSLGTDVAIAVGVGISPSGDCPGVCRRRRIFEEYQTLGFKIPPVIDPSAVFRGVAEPGAQILAGVIVQPGVVVGANAVLNTRSSVDHNCSIGAHAFLGPGALLCGDVSVGCGALIGAGATVLPGVKVGPGVVVRAGTIVAQDMVGVDCGHFSS